MKCRHYTAYALERTDSQGFTLVSHFSSPSVSCKCQPLLSVTLDLCEGDRIRLSQMKSSRTFATQHQNDYKVHTDHAVDTDHNDDILALPE